MRGTPVRGNLPLPPGERGFAEAPFMTMTDLSPRTLPLDPNVAQRRASDPTASVWVGASAGSGKTKVLTDRVLRLMLSGTPPARILCLTFTKAAAAEMAIRINRTLGLWATLPDESLEDRLADLCGERPSMEARLNARRLFAQVVDCPGVSGMTTTSPPRARTSAAPTIVDSA